MRALSTATLALFFFGCLPNPQSVKEKRESFDRSKLEGSLILDKPPSNMKPINAVFGGRVRLLGYTTDPERPSRGDTVEVRFYWTADKPIDEDYMVFVHGDAIGGNARRIHGDHYPAKGKYATDLWKVGEIVVDPFAVKIDTDYGPRQIGIYTGMYKGDYRVPLTDPGQAQRDNENRSRAIELTLD